MPSTSNQPTARLFVGSLPYDYAEFQLYQLFAAYGKIVSLKILLDHRRHSRGIGYVEYDNLQSAKTAKESLHNFLIGSRSIIVDYARPDPFLTPEGQLRHQQAENRHRPTIAPPVKRPLLSYPEKIRQTVYDSRAHGSRVGAKFAGKTRAKKKK